MNAWEGTGNCRDAVHRLYHYLDGELDDDRRAAIRNHLDECLPCLEVFDFEVELRQVIARKCRDQVPETLRIRIVQAIRYESGAVEGGSRGIPDL
jgi:mycothiol system anti-sigma-R factor